MLSYCMEGTDCSDCNCKGLERQPKDDGGSDFIMILVGVALAVVCPPHTQSTHTCARCAPEPRRSAPTSSNVR